MLAVTVTFPEGVSAEVQGPALLAFEKDLRERSGLDCRVLKAKMGDDSKLRIAMTSEERNLI